ncbi:YheU family protein [Vibrio cincinnatiensis]|uniref:Uncharacterized protein n=1 Tax=Vibrio cincinnatiensis DSM 19608 TaxID=1123491 RepID=A0A1T4QXM6_VIBCI|nr:YheU family protein [Vibrio cincinnatiensis]MCG3722171.1 YheU family protein [Vibrio cincinnatiensis]MCG3725200.1 YheU family protein [Vibrio cincinnatiensis]MCG3732244.1 YheU family protein [Vibrio cincinnatiensis]MCG3735761.1 YheU family protein [Vibrio cincinnatiensis]MCG3739665.1 YheU family protein [Vibrio cincinnatiensis]
MIVPWQQIADDTLENLIREFVLREGTDYGEAEVALQDKVEQVKAQLHAGEAVIVYSELHETIDIKSKLR